MDERPPQPPEGKLIADALARTGLSIREASRRASISYGRWRQITSGYQNVSPGSWAAVRAPAATLARMAAVVGVTADELEGARRPDAADVLRDIQQHEPSDDADQKARAQAAEEFLTNLSAEEMQELAEQFIDVIRRSRAARDERPTGTNGG